jgi:hypothetical protein
MRSPNGAIAPLAGKSTKQQTDFISVRRTGPDVVKRFALLLKSVGAGIACVFAESRLNTCHRYVH